ncbi:hypothetical protein ACGTJS_11720 [Faucicola mancuniensis]|uniref:hypothetical protein n=1 Tax=Faucicola mancuniensis TaxID=1309795 RepID=UPI003977B9EC
MKKPSFTQFALSSLLAIGAFGGLAVSQSAMAGCTCQDRGIDMGGNLCGIPNFVTGKMDAIFEKVCTADSGGYTPSPEPDPTVLRGQSDIAVALSPSTGVVGVASYSWDDASFNQSMTWGMEDFALASCLDKTNHLNTQSYNHDVVRKIIKKYGKKSDCQVVKKTENLGENLIAILRGQKSNGQYAVYWTTREDKYHLFSQQQPEFKQLLAKCQAEATNCEIIGQYGDTTEID